MCRSRISAALKSQLQIQVALHRPLDMERIQFCYVVGKPLCLLLDTDHGWIGLTWQSSLCLTPKYLVYVSDCHTVFSAIPDCPVLADIGCSGLQRTYTESRSNSHVCRRMFSF